MKKLTQTGLKKSKVTKVRLFDGSGGLFIQCNPKKTQYRYWRLKYRRPTDKKEDTFSIGTYPEITLAKAREKALEARTLIANGIDPKQEKKRLQKEEEIAHMSVFSKVAYKCIDLQGLEDNTHKKKIARLMNYVFPHIGKTPIQNIGAPDLVKILDLVTAQSKIDTAKKIRQELNQIFTYAVQMGLTKDNPAQYLNSAIPSAPVMHRAAIIEPEAFGQLLTSIDTYDKNSLVGAALKLAPLVFQRPFELVSMEWSEVDFDEALWTIPKEKKKERKHRSEDHTVPLSRQAITILKSIKKLTGERIFVFSNLKKKDSHITTASLVKALRILGYDTKTEQNTHGFRASARTLMAEQLNMRQDLIEHQLAHNVRDTLGRAYNRTTFLKERKAMMQEWANYLSSLKSHSGNTLDI